MSGLKFDFLLLFFSIILGQDDLQPRCGLTYKVCLGTSEQYRSVYTRIGLSEAETTQKQPKHYFP